MRSIVTRLLAPTLIVVTVILGASTPAAACSCAMREPSEAFELSDVVFVGEIEEIDRPKLSSFREQEARYIFSVETVYKGDAYERQSVATHSQGATCGMEISGPGRFLMFATTTANGGPAPDDGEVASSLCSGNMLIDSNSQAEGFGDGYAPLAGASPAGSPGFTALAWGGFALGMSVLLLAGLLIGIRIGSRSSSATAGAH